MDNTANSKESVDVSHLKPYQFKPGQSGNPSGRPKGTLKDFVRQRFMAMTDEEKVEWLESNKIAGIDQWKMGEGNPKQDVDTEVHGEIKIAISEDIAKKYNISDTNTSTEGNSQRHT